MKTQDQIDQEVTALLALKDFVPRRTMFGDDNHRAIDAQIEVLEVGLTMDEIYARWGEEAFLDEDEFDENALSCALEAFDWKTRTQCISPPSKGWTS